LKREDAHLNAVAIATGTFWTNQIKKKSLAIGSHPLRA